MGGIAIILLLICAIVGGFILQAVITMVFGVVVNIWLAILVAGILAFIVLVLWS